MRLLGLLLVLGACERSSAPKPRPAAVESSGVQQVVVAPPADAAVPASAPAPRLVIEIPLAGDVLADGVAIHADQLSNLFRAAYAHDRDTQVVVTADRGMPPSRAVEVMELAKQAGLTHLAIGASAAAVAPELHVQMTAGGDVFVSGVKVTPAELQQAFVDAVKQDPDTRLILEVDKNAAYKDVVALMDRATQAGLKKIALATEPAATP